MTWKAAYLETRVMSADPVELVNILYEYATLSVQDARNALADGDIAARARAIGKAIAILGELESSLDHTSGGEIAFNLARLYRYMREKLTQANLNQADGPLAEVEALLKTVGEAWEQLGREKVLATDGRHRGGAPTGWAAPAMLESMTDHSSQSWSV